MSVGILGLLSVGILGLLSVGILGLLSVGLSLRVGLGGIASLLSVSGVVALLHGLGLVGDVWLGTSLHDDELLAAGRYQAAPDPPAEKEGDRNVAARFKVPLLAESEHEAHVGDPGEAADDDPRDA